MLCTIIILRGAPFDIQRGAWKFLGERNKNNNKKQQQQQTLHPLLRLKKKKKKNRNFTHLRSKKNKKSTRPRKTSPASETKKRKKKFIHLRNKKKKKKKLPCPTSMPPRKSNGAPLRWLLDSSQFDNIFLGVL